MDSTCLRESHRRLGAVLVDFHGWEMPIRYGEIPAEHRQVRESAGLFDLCHMGRLEVDGPEAVVWIDGLVTLDVAALDPGRARYGLVCDDGGGIIDDIIVYRPGGGSDARLFIVVNASNRAAVIQWFEEHRQGRGARLRDRTFELGMIAVQGPKAAEIVAPLVSRAELPIESLPYYRIIDATVAGAPARMASTGYTGERGYEIYADVAAMPRLWDALLAAGGGRIAPIGLGARDTLRVEAGMPLYGNEIDRGVNPFEAGLGFAVKLDKAAPFVGQAALRAVRDHGPRRKLIGLRIDSRKVARGGMEVYQGERRIGAVTSGIPSPSLGYPIALALIEAGVGDPAGIAVDIRGSRFPAIPEPLPFVSRTRKRGERAL
jgi:aminomethyltransferase